MKLIKQFSYIYIIILLFFTTALTAQYDNPFHEDGNYKNYLISMIQDRDFNIINQVKPPADWLITQTYFHPAPHSESPTSIYLFGFVLEKIFLNNFVLDPRLEYRFGFTLINILFLYLGIFYLFKVSNLLNLQSGKYSIFFFLSGSVISFYALHWVSVIDVLSFGFASYLTYWSVYSIINRRSASLLDYIIWGTAVGLMSSFKMFNVLYTCFFLVLIFKQEKNKLLHTSALLIPIMLFWALQATNLYLKYELISNPVLASLSFFMTSDPLEAIKTLLFGYFSLHGVFIINLVLLLSIIGFGLAFKNYRLEILKNYKAYSVIALLLIAAYILPSLGTPSNVAEERIPGRHFFNIFPIFCLGYLYFLKNLNSKLRYVFLVVPTLTYLIYLINFVAIDFIDTYSYPKIVFLNFNELRDTYSKIFSIIKFNIHFLLQNLFPLFVFCAGCAVVFMIFLNNFTKVEKFVRHFLIFCFLSFFVMTMFNYFMSNKNIEEMKTKNLFANSTIATGPEAYSIDYVLDAIKFVISNSNIETQNIIINKQKEYFQKVRKQIKSNNSEILQKIESNDLSLSIWIKYYEAKKDLQK